ncbi:MAG: O-antigen ligase family protein [Patescibacteria group bacterium]|jgi:O-antigen ligase
MDRAVLISVTLIAALLPLERVGAFSIAGLNVRPSQIALLIAWLLFARLWLLGRTSFEWRSPVLLALAGFFAAAGLSLLNSENLTRSLVVLAFTIFTASLVLLLPNVLKSENDFKRVRVAILFAAALMALLGLWQFVADMFGLPLWMTGLRETYSRAILGFTRVQATAAEPLYFANYLLLPIALAGAWLLKNPEAKTRRWLSLLLAMLCVNVFLTSSRGGWLGAAVTVATLLWMERSRLRDMRPLLRAAGITITSIAVGVLLLGSFFSTSRETVTDTFFRHVTTVTDGAAFDDRAQTIVAAFEAWKLHPWIGVGFGGYGPFVSTFAFSKPEAGWPIVNNETLELLSETGMIGLATFVLFLIVLFRETSPRREDGIETIRIACTTALLGMLAQYQTFSTLYIMHVWFTIGLLLATSKPTRA